MIVANTFVTIAFVTSLPISRRTRPAKDALSREAVIAAAMRILREEGLANVSMRRLASDLDTGPASLYVYITNVAELHGAILDELLGDLVLPPRVTRMSWRDDVVRVLADVTTMLLGQPGLAASVLSLRPSGPRYLALLDWLLQALRCGGAGPRAAAWGADLLLQQVTTTAAEHSARQAAVEAPADESSLARTVRQADPVAAPGLSWARAELFSGTGEQRLAWALGCLLAGIEAAPEI